MRAYKGLSSTATSVAFRPEGADGKGGAGQGSLVCGGEDGIMWLLDASKAGRPKRVMRMHVCVSYVCHVCLCVCVSARVSGIMWLLDASKAGRTEWVFVSFLV